MESVRGEAGETERELDPRSERGGRERENMKTRIPQAIYLLIRPF